MRAIARPTLAGRAGSAVTLLAVCTLLAGCGAGADEPSLTAGQAAGLQQSISAARGGAEQGDPAAVHSALERFSRDVRLLAADGTLSEDRAQALLSGAEQSRRRVAVDITPVTSPSDVPADGRGEKRGQERLDEGQHDKEDEREAKGDKDGKDDKEDKGRKGDKEDKEDDDEGGDGDD